MIFVGWIGNELIFSTDATAMKVFADQNVNWKIRAF